MAIHFCLTNSIRELIYSKKCPFPFILHTPGLSPTNPSNHGAQILPDLFVYNYTSISIIQLSCTLI